MEVFRHCGSCSLCCKLLAIPALDKPGGKWCQHCAPGRGGCTIYDQRPHVCHQFACQWLTDSLLGDDWFPPRAKMFIYLDISVEPNLLRVVVDQSAPYRWREEPFCSWLQHVSDIGLRSDRFHVVAQYGERHWLLTPTGDHEVTESAYIVTEDDEGTWSVSTRLEKCHGHLARR